MNLINLPQEIFSNILSFIPDIFDICINIYSTCRKFKLFVKYYTKLNKLIPSRFLRLIDNKLKKVFRIIISDKCLCQSIKDIKKCDYCYNTMTRCIHCNESFSGGDCINCDKSYCSTCIDEKYVMEKCGYCSENILCIDCYENKKIRIEYLKKVYWEMKTYLCDFCFNSESDKFDYCYCKRFVRISEKKQCHACNRFLCDYCMFSPKIQLNPTFTQANICLNCEVKEYSF